MSYNLLLRLVIVIVLPTGIGFGQNVGRVVSYTTISDGIGSNAADFAIQDKYGFIWDFSTASYHEILMVTTL